MVVAMVTINTSSIFRVPSGWRESREKCGARCWDRGGGDRHVQTAGWGAGKGTAQLSHQPEWLGRGHPCHRAQGVGGHMGLWEERAGQVLERRFFWDLKGWG